MALEQFQINLAVDDIPEDVDAFQLAGPSEEESQSVEDISSESDGEWIMANRPDKEVSDTERSDEEFDKHDSLQVGRNHSRENPYQGRLKAPANLKNRLSSTSKVSKNGVFASAEDYAHLLNEDTHGQKPRKRSRT